MVVYCGINPDHESNPRMVRLTGDEPGVRGSTFYFDVATRQLTPWEGGGPVCVVSRELQLSWERDIIGLDGNPEGLFPDEAEKWKRHLTQMVGNYDRTGETHTILS